MPIYVYYGEDAFLIEDSVKILRHKLVNPAFASLSHKILNAPSVDATLEAVGMGSLAFGSHTLIECHNPPYLTQAAKDKGTELQLESLKALLSDLPEDRSVLFASQKVDGKLKFNKWLLKQPFVTAHKMEAFKFWETSQAADYVMSLAHQHEVKLKHQAAEQLVTVLGVDRRLLNNEIQKLSLLKDQFPVIDQQVIEQLGYHSDNAFELVHRWLRNQQPADNYDDLHLILQHKHPMELFALIHSYTNTLFKICDLARRGCSPDQIASKTSQKPFTVKKHLQNFSRIPAPRWQAIKTSLLDMEWKVKTGQLDGQVALECLLSH